jgi:predicted phosphodiesterase
MGNHDRMVVDEGFDLSKYPDFITEPILWTRDNLKGRYREYLENLPDTYETDDIFMTHTFPGDSYIFTDEEALPLLEETDKVKIVVGHTHTQHVFRFGERVVINPGSITHGRKGHSRGFAILNGDDVTLGQLRSIT